MRTFVAMAMLLAAPAWAQPPVANQTLPAGAIISDADITGDGAGVVGMQTRVAIYAGRPIPATALRTPVVVSRNQITRITYSAGPLTIETEVRTLAEGAEGQVIRVMNTTSRNIISARVNPDGSLTALN